ncbi:MAG: FxsA family protein [Acidimicrobiaceae bacterium]|nr:FxsA family protein [Acidimicrobiaceae bacterium]
MLAILLFALLCIPLLELFVIVQLSDFAGFWQTITLMVLVSVVGAFMVRHSGFGIMQKMRSRLAQGELPAAELVEGVLILVSGALMLTPGFFTDTIGLLLLVQPTRVIVRKALMRYFSKKIQVVGWSDNLSSGGFWFGEGRGRYRGFGPDDDDLVP